MKHVILSRYLPVFLMLFVIWMVLVGNVTIGAVVLGLLSSAIIALFMADMMFEGSIKTKSSPRTQIVNTLLLIYNVMIQSLQKHLDVIKKIFSLKMELRPGIVKVPFKLHSELGTVIAANSIAYSPGTIVVEIDREKNYYYVHWIDVEDTDPDAHHKKILGFEDYIGDAIG